MDEKTPRIPGIVEAYWEQGWEGAVLWAFSPDPDPTAGQPPPIFLQAGQYLWIYDEDGSLLWSGAIDLVASTDRDRRGVPGQVWAPDKQRGVSYAQWMAWFRHNPPLRAELYHPA